MPSSNTVTAFYTFVSGTRARASQVNNNFDIFRGHLIPIETNTATAADASYDLGSTDYRWRRIYLSETPYVNGVQVGQMQIPVLQDGTFPCDLIESNNDLDSVAFRSDETTGVIFKFVVPPEYATGNRLSLSMRGYCETATSHFTMEMVSALFKASLTAMDSTALSNLFTATSNISPALAGAYFTDSSLKITTASGTINSVTVTAGDVIVCALKRYGNATADTNTGYFFLTNAVIDLNN